MLRSITLSVLLATLSLGTIAQNRESAYQAAGADCLTTGAALAAGFAEANPLGPIAACALKPALIEAAMKLPEPQRSYDLAATHAIWTGATANNLTLVVGKLASVSLASVAPVVGVVVALVVWERSAQEREFGRLCAVHRELASNPDMTCTYTR